MKIIYYSRPRLKGQRVVPETAQCSQHPDLAITVGERSKVPFSFGAVERDTWVPADNELFCCLFEKRLRPSTVSLPLGPIYSAAFSFWGLTALSEDGFFTEKHRLGEGKGLLCLPMTDIRALQRGEPEMVVSHIHFTFISPFLQRSSRKHTWSWEIQVCLLPCHRLAFPHHKLTCNGAILRQGDRGNTVPQGPWNPTDLNLILLCLP